MSSAEVTPIRTNTEPLEILRAKFPESVIGKLPRVTCKACSNRSCTSHKPAKCQTCGAYVTPAHIHLDYVGHAEVTDRLLSADPAWNWEPLVWSDEGFPKFTKGASGEMELWIKLTVGGVTRLGVGSVAGNAFDAEKQLIGDALRNAAMRFGVALDLWAKEELESHLPGTESPKKRAAKPEPAPVEPPADVDADTGEVRVRRGPPKKEPMSGRPTDQRPPTPEQIADLEDITNALKEAGEEWAALGRARWAEAGLPKKSFGHLNEDEAAKAFEVLAAVLREVPPVLDAS